MQTSVLVPLASAAFAAALLALPPTASRAGDRVGVAAAVKPLATSKLAGGATRTLKIGKSVFYNERIVTSNTGVVQVLLVDGSTFTVGPKSTLVIDKFIYNPNTGSGALAATLSKGALRFVGGKLSKQEPGVKVKTPAGELSVRGGIFQGIVYGSNQAIFDFVFGHRLSIRRGGRLYTLRHTGNLFAIGRSGAPVIRQTTPADTKLIMSAVSGKGFKTFKIKADGWPFYYGIQPTGRYPDEPFIEEQFFRGNPIKLHRVPNNKVVTPHKVRKPYVRTPITSPGYTRGCPNC